MYIHIVLTYIYIYILYILLPQAIASAAGLQVSRTMRNPARRRHAERASVDS